MDAPKTMPEAQIRALARFATPDGPKGWPYHDAFNRRYWEYRDRTGQSNEQVAAALGVAPDTLNGYRRTQGARTPSEETLLHASILFACDIHEFMPDFGAVKRELEWTSNDPARISAEEPPQIPYPLSFNEIWRRQEISRLLGDSELTEIEKDLMVNAMRECHALIGRLRAESGARELARSTYPKDPRDPKYRT